MFFKHIDNPIGLDISDLSVKLVQIQKTSTELQVSSYCDVNLPPGVIVDDMIAKRDDLIRFLQELLRNRSQHHGRLHGRSIVASVPESKAFVRVINFPDLQAEELATAVPLEAEQYIPLPLDEMQLDWQIVGNNASGLKVLITATPKSYVEDLADVFARAGLVVQALELESAAVVRALLSAAGEKEPTLILDLNAHRTSIIIFSDNSIQFTSSIPVGGSILTDAIGRRLGVSKQEAEQIKRMHGIPLGMEKSTGQDNREKFSEIRKALEPALSNLYDEVKNTIKFQEVHGPQTENPIVVLRVLICGGTAKLPNLAQYLQDRIASDAELPGDKIKVDVANAWQNLYGTSAPPFSRHEALSYTTAIGLALRNHLA